MKHSHKSKNTKVAKHTKEYKRKEIDLYEKEEDVGVPQR